MRITPGEGDTFQDDGLRTAIVEDYVREREGLVDVREDPNGLRGDGEDPLTTQWPSSDPAILSRVASAQQPEYHDDPHAHKGMMTAAQALTSLPIHHPL